VVCDRAGLPTEVSNAPIPLFRANARGSCRGSAPMKSKTLMRLANRRLQYKVTLEERMRVLEAELEATTPDSAAYWRVADEVAEIQLRARRNWRHVEGILGRALGITT
jgi:hypothetical protein